MANKKEYLKIVLILLFFTIIISCKKKQCFEIIDEQHFKFGNAQYSVYYPDTNWIEMEEFAKNLLKDKEKHSDVIFFSLKSEKFKFKKNGDIEEDALNYYTAIYNLDTNGKYIFHKSENRFRKDMMFEKCY